MERVRKLNHKGKEVIVVDYSGCTGDQAIEVLDLVKSLIIAEKKNCVVLYVTSKEKHTSPKFMRHLEKTLPEIEPFIERQAIVGVTLVKEWIVRGVNHWAEKKTFVFDTSDQALDYLASEPSNKE
ncbi:MAG: STAS/SEC14 domain-containing protein [Bacteroidetes bacterium]|nr:STAS/SEC14 domain-containing protein [Bacteroidota bacterium]